MALRNDLCHWLDELLRTATIDDYSRNGLQIEGSERVERIGFAVDGCRETFRMAAERECDMLIVHHGIIWGGIPAITGPVYHQVADCITNRLNLYGSHLPLDCHPAIGNNIELVKILAGDDIVPFGDYKGSPIGFSATLPEPLSTGEVARRLDARLGGASSTLALGQDTNRTIGVVSGGGGDCLAEAITKNIDCFITGECSHQHYHQALEGGINVVLGGHYHTETVGLQALMKEVEKEWEVKTLFLDAPTPL